MYVADFETTTDLNDCRVWAWGKCPIDDYESFTYGNSIESFFDCIKESCVMYFHNLAFDGSFIIDHVMRILGYEHVEKATMNKNCFSTVISRLGKFYSIKISHQGKIIEFRDSYKLLPFSVKKIAEDLHLPVQKGELDYNAFRPVGHILTDREISYLKRDVVIIAMGLRQTSLDGLTIGSYSFRNYKNTHPNFSSDFPVLSVEYDSFIRKSYRGGYVYCNPKMPKETHCGQSVDYNSMYPSMMLKYPLPYGEPTPFSGKYDGDGLFVQKLICMFKLKENRLPCIQLNNVLGYGLHEYVEETHSEVELTLTNIDLELLHLNYDVDVVAYCGGFSFSSKKGMFDKYITFWRKIKEKSKGALRLLAKLMLNSLYGKFGTNPDVTQKIPELIDGKIKMVLGDEKQRDPIYVALASFVTAYARRELVTAILKNYDRFIYCDTDSIHLLGWEEPDGIELDDNEFCHWKVEGWYHHAKHIRAKCYVWDLGMDGKDYITCAGMPDNIKSICDFDSFDVGFSNMDGNGDVIPGAGKLVPLRVEGGVVLVERPYRLR